MEYILNKLRELMAIPSPSGFTREAAEYAVACFGELGFDAGITKKGCVIADLGGEGDPLMLAAHIDTLGGMVAEIKENGRLKLTRVGGLQPNNIETENCVIHTRFGSTFTGCMQLNDPSVHVNDKYAKTERAFDGMEVVIDENVSKPEDTQALGISVGDYVCFDPRLTVTDTGYIKSRFLDDKLSAATLLGFAKYIADNSIALKRKLYVYFTVYEEVGHGCSALPVDINEMLCVDMGCVGKGLTCDERMVSICAKDSGGPYNYEMTTQLIRLAKDKGIDYAVDVYPFYGSDAEASLAAGYDIRHALIGAGVYASHGYERSHVDGVRNTLELIKAYALE